MASVLNTIDSAHENMIHDAALDYYGTKLATCSSDKTIKIFNVQNGQHQLLAELRSHEGPVWQVSWAHPRHGNVLASCSYDRTVIIWKEENNKWNKWHVYSEHNSSVNSVAWAPPEFGLIFACASSDGSVSVVGNTGGNDWSNIKKIQAHSNIGCNAVSWAPYFSGTTIDASGVERSEPQQRLVTGGCDNLVKIWRLGEQGWEEEQKLEGHSDWVRDVAWAPSLIVPRNIIASCSQDRFVIIWSYDESLGGSWEMKTLPMFDDIVWHLSWSVTGNILAVSTGDNKVSLWKETVKGDWANISETSST